MDKEPRISQFFEGPLGSSQIIEPDKPKCEVCGKQNETVRKRICAYELEIKGSEVFEVVCNDCENAHREEV